MPVDVIAALHRLGCEIAADRMLRGLDKLERACKANFDPNQPRVPAGSPEGGQWTHLPGWSSSRRILSDATPDNAWRPGAEYAQTTPRPPRGGVRPVQINGRWVLPTSAQAYRLSNAESRAERAVARVRALDPNWRPKAGLSESIEGRIRETEAQAREAEARFEQLRAGIGGNFGPSLTPSPGASPRQSFDGPSWIAAYRAAHSRRDLFGNATGLSERDTVAVTELDGKPIFGTNSDALTYTNFDRATAQRHVDAMIEKYPKIMSAGNLGGIPNNALYHAESTILLRVARENGGTLADRTLEVHVDRRLCYSCEVVLPTLGSELGNPAVTFVTPSHIYVMQNGAWISRTRR